jgi:hypothetical protein
MPDGRGESSGVPRTARRPLQKVISQQVAGFIVFFLAGLAFGYAAPGAWGLFPVVIPFFMGLYTGLSDGFDGHVILFMIIGIIVSLVGSLIGRVLQYRFERDEAPG